MDGLLEKAPEFDDTVEHDRITCGGVLMEIKEAKTRKGQEMAVLEIGTLTGSRRVTVFPRPWQLMKGTLQEGEGYLFTGSYRKSSYGFNFLVETAEPLFKEQYYVSEKKYDKEAFLKYESPFGGMLYLLKPDFTLIETGKCFSGDILSNPDVHIIPKFE